MPVSSNQNDPLAPPAVKFDLHEVEPAILAACYECHQDGRPLPGYAEIGRIAGRGEDWGRMALSALMARGLLTGMAGRKPTGMTESGRAAALRALRPCELMTTPAAAAPRSALVEELAGKWGIDSGRMFNLVAKTMISKRDSDGPVTVEEVAVVMHVMRQYDLDPLLKQLHAFVTEGKLQVMLGYDGWVRQVNKARGAGVLGVGFSVSPDEVKVPGGTNVCPSWIEATLHWAPETGRFPTTYRAYFGEWFVPNKNWRDRPYHRLRMKAFCQVAREGLGIGLSDEIDHEQMAWRADPASQMQGATESRTATIKERLAEMQVFPADIVQPSDPKPTVVYPDPDASFVAYSDGEAPSESADSAGASVTNDGQDYEFSAPDDDQGPPDDLDLDRAIIEQQRTKGEIIE